MNIKHQVSSNFIVEAVDNFFDFRATHNINWVSDASQSLKENLLNMVEQCGVGEDSTPSSIVDNFLINSDFVSRENDEHLWLEGVDLTDMEGNMLEGDDLEDVRKTAWNKYCQEKAIIYNDEYACLSF